MTAGTQEEIASNKSTRREIRRLQLIQATMNVIAQHGFSDATLARISTEAGLNIASVKMYFSNKETLLAETLKFMSEEYEQHWIEAAKHAKNPADKLKALIEADFSIQIADPVKVAIWFAFLGEAKTRPVYADICDLADENYFNATIETVSHLIDEGGYDIENAEETADMILALEEGLWLNLLLSTDPNELERSKSIVFHLLEKLFPKHFPR